MALAVNSQDGRETDVNVDQIGFETNRFPKVSDALRQVNGGYQAESQIEPGLSQIPLVPDSAWPGWLRGNRAELPLVFLAPVVSLRETGIRWTSGTAPPRAEESVPHPPRRGDGVVNMARTEQG